MDLYALPPEEFTAARDAAAKEDKSLKALRRPTVAAWVVNTLVRREGRLLDDLVGLGQELAAATSGRDADALRELGRQRKELVAAVTQRAVELVDRDVTAAVRLEVEQTLEAALADPASGEAVRSGQLTRALQYAGFGGVDLEGAVAPLPPARPAAEPRQDKAAGKRVAKLEAEALEAQGALDDAVRRAEQVARALEAAERDLATVQEETDAADAAVAEAQAALEAAQAAAGEAAGRRTAARRAHEDAERRAARATEAVRAAQEAAEQARARLDAARRD